MVFNAQAVSREDTSGTSGSGGSTRPDELTADVHFDVFAHRHEVGLHFVHALSSR